MRNLFAGRKSSSRYGRSQDAEPSMVTVRGGDDISSYFLLYDDGGKAIKSLNWERRGV
jgi:hypothetical protein